MDAIRKSEADNPACGVTPPSPLGEKKKKRKLERHIAISATEGTYRAHHHITPPVFVRCIITLLYSQFTQLPGEQKK